MPLRRVTCHTGTIGLLPLGGLSPAAITAPAPSCVGQFVIASAPHSAGRAVARTTEPKLGVGDVAPDATSEDSNCS